MNLGKEKNTPHILNTQFQQGIFHSTQVKSLPKSPGEHYHDVTRNRRFLILLLSLQLLGFDQGKTTCSKYFGEADL